MISFWRSAALGVVSGCCAGALLTLLELFFLPAPARSPELVLLLGAILVAGSGLSAAILGPAALAFGHLARGVARAARLRSAPVVGAGLLALASAPGALWLVNSLASGPRARQLIGAAGVRVGLVCLFVVLAWLGIWATWCLGQRTARSSRRLAGVILGGLLIAAAVGLFWADVRLYRRLYGYLHLLLWLGYCVAAWLGSLSVLRALVPRLRANLRLQRAGVILSLGCLVLGFWSARGLIMAKHGHRFVAAEQSTATAKWLDLFPRRVDAEEPFFLTSPTPIGPRARETLSVRGANVVFVTVDALRADHLGAYGYRRKTSPNIDALSARATRFDHAYCQVPLTCYSVPSLFTGDYLRSTLSLLPAPPLTLADILKANGYRTAAFYNESIFFCDDKRATSYGDRRFGFDYAETELLSAPLLSSRVLSYLRRFEQRDQKLFLWVHYFDVHEPYRRRKNPDFGSRAIDRYDSEIAFVDRAIGRLIAALGRLRRRTIFVLTSDHGEEFGEHGGNYHGSSLYEEQIRVPLIIGVPGLDARVVSDPAQLVDVVPTVLSLLGIASPATVRGTSLVPQLQGHTDPSRAAYSEVDTKKMVRVGPWKLIHDFRRSTYELFALHSDPKERTNLIDKRPREAARLKAWIHRWFDRLRGLQGGDGETDRPEAIDLGRIGDRRAVPPLGQLVADSRGKTRWRSEAARLLGRLHDDRARPALWQAAGSDDELVAADAAISLGELNDRRAALLLERLFASSDENIRLRAGIAAARLGSVAATPVLVEALSTGNWDLQHRAAHYLGFVGDARALDPLLQAMTWSHLRSRVAVALGRLGRRHGRDRVLPALLGMARDDSHLEVRQRAVAGLAYLQDQRAIESLVGLLHAQPELTWVPETLTRLHALGAAGLHGIDWAPGWAASGRGWGNCHGSRSESLDNFVGRTWCAMQSRGAVSVRLPRRPRGPVLMLLRIALAQPAAAGGTLTVTINGQKAASLRLRRGWRVVRRTIPAEVWRAGDNAVELNLAAHGRGGEGQAKPGSEVLRVDYLLVANIPS